MEILQF